MCPLPGDDGLLEVFLDYRPDLKTTVVRRGNGGTWTYHYNDAGTITQIVDPYGDATSFTVDETGRVIAETDPKGNVTQLLYDGLGGPHARLDPLGHMLPTYADDPNPPDPLAYELPETPLEWEHGGLLGKGEIGRLAPGDPALQDFPAVVQETFLSPRRALNGTTEDKGVAGEDLEPPNEDEEGRPVEQGSPGHMRQWRYDPNGNLAEYQDRDGAVYRYVYTSWNAVHQDINPLGHATVYHHSSQGLGQSRAGPGRHVD